MKFESCDWCPAPPSSNGFFAALVFGGELPNGFLFEIAAGFIHRENRLHRRFSFEIQVQLLSFAVAVCWSSGIGKTGENRWRSIGGLFFTSFDTSHDSILVFISFLPLSYPLNRLKWLEIATRDQERLQLQMRQVKFNLFQYSPRYRQSWFQPIHLLIFRSTPWYHRKLIKHT